MSNNKVSFWRIFWPSLIAGIVLIFVFFIFLTGIIGSAFNVKQPEMVKDKTILHLKLDKSVNEKGSRGINVDLGGINLTQNIGLSDLLYGFEKAAKDDKIAGVFIELEGANCGYAMASSIREAIKRFEEESGKFVVAYHRGEAITLKQYYIASAASENYGFHSSNLEFLGLGTELMFYKGLFDKLEVEMQVIRGPNNDFKSAVEPYFLTEMSDSSRLQIERYLNNIWSDVKEKISKDRNLTIKDLEDIADNGYVKTVQQAVDYKLLDATKYRDEVIQLLADKVSASSTKDLNLSSFEKYATQKFETQQAIANAKNANVAVIIAEGDITVAGSGIASDRLTKLIRKAREDKDIKTIVLRVNSPGGSALASDEIWREVNLANKEKNVIVSMGDLAASGGYYISSPASKIFAQENTITGSIGVFGVIPYTGQFLENKLGISFDRVGTNKYSTSITTNKKLSLDEFNLIQSEVNSIYEEFLDRVSEGRNMTKEQVNVVARGRVWTGVDALRVGLVDTLGGLNDAIAYAIKEANIEKPVIRYYPKIEKDELIELIEMIEDRQKGNTNIKVETIPSEMVEIYQHVKKIENMNGILARMPYDLIW